MNQATKNSKKSMLMVNQRYFFQNFVAESLSLVSLLNDVSTFVGYLMPKLSL